jgi:hypothetical protein
MCLISIREISRKYLIEECAFTLECFGTWHTKGGNSKSFIPNPIVLFEQPFIAFALEIFDNKWYGHMIFSHPHDIDSEVYLRRSKDVIKHIGLIEITDFVLSFWPPQIFFLVTPCNHTFDLLK